MLKLRRESREKKRYIVFSKGKNTGWMEEDNFDSLKEAEKEAERVSRNAYDSKIVDSNTGKAISYFHDMLKKEDNNYSATMGVDDIEDIIAAGLDWTQADFKEKAEKYFRILPLGLREQYPVRQYQVQGRRVCSCCQPPGRRVLPAP